MPYLVISRKIEQSIVLVRESDTEPDETITFKYAGRHGSEVRFGISAEMNYRIIREEEIAPKSLSETYDDEYLDNCACGCDAETGILSHDEDLSAPD